jgi:hypothetical protein
MSIIPLLGCSDLGNGSAEFELGRASQGIGAANGQEVEGRSRIESGIARMTNTDTHHSRCIPRVHLTIGPLFTQITSYFAPVMVVNGL